MECHDSLNSFNNSLNQMKCAVTSTSCHHRNRRVRVRATMSISSLWFFSVSVLFSFAAGLF